jgi:putative dimethyl sulfoxide reductase chaperone
VTSLGKAQFTIIFVRKPVDQTLNTNLDWTATLTGEMLLFGLLGKLIYSDPDQTWLQSLINAEVFSEVPLGNEEHETQIGLETINRWIQGLGGKIDETCLNALKAEYVSLFIGPGKMLAPLWESVYFSEEHQMFQARTLSVRYWYRRFGLEVEHVNREPDDHIGIEFSFLAHLAGLALQALEEKNTVRFESLIKAQKGFFSEHLLQWGPEWAGLVIKHAQSDFYRGLGHLGLGSIQAVANILQVTAPAKAQK